MPADAPGPGSSDNDGIAGIAGGIAGAAVAAIVVAALAWLLVKRCRQKNEGRDVKLDNRMQQGHPPPPPYWALQKVPPGQPDSYSGEALHECGSMQPWAFGRSRGYNPSELRVMPTTTFTAGSSWSDFQKCALLLSRKTAIALLRCAAVDTPYAMLHTSMSG